MTFQQLAKKTFGSPAVSTRLDEDVDDVAILIDGTPEILPLSLDGDEDLVQVPCVSQATLAARRFSPRAYSGPTLMPKSEKLRELDPALCLETGGIAPDGVRKGVAGGAGRRNKQPLGQ